MKRGSPDGGGVASSEREILSGAAGSSSSCELLLLFSSDGSALTGTGSRVQEKGQERALWSGDLHRLQRRRSGQSEAR